MLDIRYILFGTLALALSIQSTEVRAENLLDSQAKLDAIIAQGVPADSLRRITRFLKDNQNRTVSSQTYLCLNQPEKNVSPCEKTRRYRSTLALPVKIPRYAAVADMTLPSTDKRLFLIDLETGQVERFHVTHGRGSGIGKYATRFSNEDESHQTSLGLYMVKGTYSGKYGPTLRLYGLENSNSIAYERDIVMHGAWYAKPSAVKKLRRLGLSHGCPAVDPVLMKKLIAKLKDGAILDVYHADLMNAATSGHPVQTASKEAEDGIINPD